MKLIEPSFEILSKIDGIETLRNIEFVGRTCYKSEERITEDSAKEFIKMLINKGHESVLEHEKITVKFICDRGVSHEIVRHRIASFSQESTRYCNYSKDKFGNELTFIIPEWIKITPGNYTPKESGGYGGSHSYIEKNGKAIEYPNYQTQLWLEACYHTELSYNWLIENKWQPQQARTVLPNSLKTEIVVTANLREWRTIFKQRTSKAAHPQMRQLMCPLLDALKVIIPVVFDDINY